MIEPDPFDLVRAWFASYNRGALDRLSAFYAEDAQLLHDGSGAEGAEAVVRAWRERFELRAPALEGGHRRRVRTIGRLENGLIRADWIEREQDPDGTMHARAGCSEFRIAHGRIQAQRDVTYGDLTDLPAIVLPDVAGPPPRRYPPRPVVGVGGVILDGGRVVLIRRRYEPLAGQWSLPGGTLDLGESIEAGVAREMLEETGLVVDVGPVVEVFDRILFDAEGRVQYHFVLIDYLCRPIGGKLAAGSDVDAAVLADPADLGQYGLTAKSRAVIARGVELAEGWR